MKNNIGAIVVIAILIVGAVIFTMTKKDSNTTSPNTSANTMTHVELPISAQNNSGQSGKAIFTDVGGKTKVVIEITPGPKGVAQPAHIHAGTCSGLGAVKYTLTDVVDGRSETTLAPVMHFLHGLAPIAINVHKSNTESGIYAGCGDISPSFDQAMKVQ